MTTDNKQVLTDAEIDEAAMSVDPYGDILDPRKRDRAMMRGVERAVLTKLRGAGEPSDDEIIADMEARGWLYMDGEDRTDIIEFARALLSRYAAPQASAEVRNVLPEDVPAVMVQHLRDAVEGECDGLDITEAQARMILGFMLSQPGCALKSAPAAENCTHDFDFLGESSDGRSADFQCSKCGKESTTVARAALAAHKADDVRDAKSPHHEYDRGFSDGWDYGHKHGRDWGFNAGVCASLAHVRAQDNGVLWREIVHACGKDELFQYAAHVEPEEWKLAGFDYYAKTEFGEGKPRKRAAIAQQGKEGA